MSEHISRRGLLKGLAATAAGLLLPADVAAEPERRVWALDSTMLRTPVRYGVVFQEPDGREWGIETYPGQITLGDYAREASSYFVVDPGFHNEEIIFFDDRGILRRNDGTGSWRPAGESVPITILGPAAEPS